jgi:hypothetical protein
MMILTFSSLIYFFLLIRRVFMINWWEIDGVGVSGISICTLIDYIFLMGNIYSYETDF